MTTFPCRPVKTATWPPPGSQGDSSLLRLSLDTPGTVGCGVDCGLEGLEGEGGVDCGLERLKGEGGVDCGLEGQGGVDWH